MSNYFQAPIVIGATPGSGTHAIAHICHRLGYFMGSNLDTAFDSLDFNSFYYKWIGTGLSKNIGNLSDENAQQMYHDFQESVNKHRANIPTVEAPWGWQNSHTIYMVPFIRVFYPEMKFIHVIRDGRDIAFNKSQKQIIQYAQIFLGDNWKSLSLPSIAMLMWEATNLTIASYCENYMAKNYIRIRFEDLCENPHGITKRLLNFLNTKEINTSSLLRGIKVPADIGKWHNYPLDFVEELERLCSNGLVKFGYISR